ncbi:hypothetical protein [[Clostridium] hylemonae]|uniref:hypothetical protein n=1 Tax=[Clostridium] hylemonae TaxID=89153 RepID=UPI001105AA75|nr:hypothetical protein [[Clostridium] hylemonae]
MKKALKYQLSDLRIVFIVYFAILVFLYAIGSIGLNTVKVNFSSGSVSIGLSGAFVCLITGMVMFQEHFWMLIQNGFSRKIYFKSSLCTISIFSIVFAIAEGLMSKLIELTFLSHRNIIVKTSIKMIFPSLHEKLDGGMGFILNIMLTAVMTACLFMVGYLLAGIFYRLPKQLKTPFAICLPVFLFVVLPVLISIFPSIGNTFVRFLLTVMGISSQNMLLTFLFFTVLFGLLSAASYITVKRAEVN